MNMWKEWFTRHGRTVACGILMGGADIIPGVSGGTVALIVGIYERLIGAISNIDRSFLRLVSNRQWWAAARHVDLAFLLSLATGILCGLVIMTTLMHFLLSTAATSALTMALFFGLIAASAYVVGRMVEVGSGVERARVWLLGVVGAGAAWWIAGLAAGRVEEPHLGFIFCSAMVAICAMILPGISGAMILLILGVYLHLTEIPGNLLRGREVVNSLVTLVVFGAGCAVGLLAFSKFLRWLLRRHHAATLAVLCGFMVGSLRKLWPFREDLTPDVLEVKRKVFRPIWPAQFDQLTVGIILVALAGVALVLLVQRYAPGRMPGGHGDGATDAR